MDFGDTGIDLNAEPKSGDFEILPKGKYQQQLTVIDIEEKESGAVMVNLESEILEGPFTGRTIWTSINIIKKDKTPNAIGNGQISALAKACGKASIPNKQETLLGIPHIASIIIEKGTPEYPNDKNKMVGFYPVDGTKKTTTEEVKEDVFNNDAHIPF